MTAPALRTPFTKRLGALLQQQRHRVSLSQAQLAERADLSLKYLGEVERGEANVTAHAIERIANVLGWDPWTLFSIQPPPITRGVHRLLVTQVDDARRKLQAVADCLEAFDPAHQEPEPPELMEQRSRPRGRPPKRDRS